MRSKTLPLKLRILLPFVLIQLLLGTVAIVGSTLLIRQELLNSADEKLGAFEAVVLREIKKQEFSLETFSHLLAYQAAMPADAPEGGILQNELYASLSEGQIAITYYPANYAALPFPQLRELFADAVASGKTRFRFDSATGTVPSLCSATAILRAGTVERLLLLQTPINPPLLKRLGTPFKIDLQLLSRDGAFLTGSTPGAPKPQLTADELARVLTGGRLYKTVDNPLRRQCFSAIPLGGSDIVILASELPVDYLGQLTGTLATRSGIAIGLLLSAGTILYVRIIRSILAPLKTLRRSAEAVANGRLQHRLEVNDGGEFGQVATAFNHMLDELERRHTAEVAAEHDTTVASDEARYRTLLAEKEREVEETGRELKARIHENAAFFQLSQALVATLDLQVIFDRTLSTIKEVVQGREVVLFLYEAANDSLQARKTLGLDPQLLRDRAIPLDEGICGLAARSRELQYVRDVSLDARHVDFRGRSKPTGSLVALPLSFKGELLGVLALQKERPNAFSETDLKLLQVAGNQLAMAACTSV